MKKIIALLVITFSIFSFYSCKEDKDNTPTSKPYTNISLQDAKRYVGLDYNSVKSELEAKGFRLGDYYPEEVNIYGYTNADTTLSYSLFINSSNIIYRVNYGKMSKNIDNTLSNFEFCRGECINEVNNSSDFTYMATNNILFGDIFDSQEEFQNYFNQNKYSLFYCLESWQSDRYIYGIDFINLKKEEQFEFKTSSNTTTTPTTPEEEQTYTNPYGVGVVYIDKSLAPEETFDKSNLIRNSGIFYLLKR